MSHPSWLRLPGSGRPALAILLGVVLAGCGDDPASPSGATASGLPAADAGVAASAPLEWEQIGAGFYSTCGVTTDHNAWCWGEGALGDGIIDDRLSMRPRLVSGGLEWLVVNTGADFACGLTLDRKAYCWGLNGVGQLGNGTRETAFAPVPVAGGHKFRQLRLGYDHACGATPDNVAYCWGRNEYGQIGDGTTIDRSKPTRVTGGRHYSRVRAGAYFTCGVTTGNLAYCWGRNDFGQLGDGTTIQRLSPTAVKGGLKFTLAAPGVTHACGIATDQRLWCWGRNDHYQLGDGTVNPALAPRLVASGSVRFTDLALGQWHTCARATTDLAYCWGDNAVGSLGTGTFATATKPALVSGGRRFPAISVAGGRQSCGVTAAHVAFCWGWNSAGQVGDGTQTDRNVPVKVVGP